MITRRVDGLSFRSRELFSRRAFSLVELLVTVAVSAILAGLLATAIAKANGKAQGIMCLDNAKQLTLAWLLYASDNNDRLPYNLGGSATTRGLAPRWDNNWVNNIMTWETDPDNTNRTFVSKGGFAPYANRAWQIYRCPADHILSEVQRQAGWSDGRVRSYSMNAMVGDAGENSRNGTNIFNPEYKQFMKMSDFVNPTGIFTFVDEHPDSINDGYFLNQVDELEWVDLPASYHNGAASFSFADGHADAHRWVFAATKPPARPDVVELPIAVTNNARADLDWVFQRTTIER